MIAILGATGTAGRELLRALSAAGASVRVVARDPVRARAVLGPGVRAVQGDLDQPKTLVRALSGAERAFVASAVDERYVERLSAFVSAAQAARVPHVVKLSALGADADAPAAILRQHALTDALLQGSGLAVTLLRPGPFFQNFLAAAGRLRRPGELRLPLGSARQALVDVRDVAAVATRTLTRRGHAGRTYELTGPESLTPAEVAAVFARVLRRPVRYVDVPPAQARRALRRAGLSPWAAQEVVRLQQVLATGAGGRTSESVQKLLGRPPTALETWVRAAAGAFR